MLRVAFSMTVLMHWIATYGYGGLTALLMLGIVGLPIPDETLLVFAGFLIWQGKLNPLLTFAAGWAGAASGITISFLLGRWLGRTVVDRYGRYLHLTHQRLNKLERWFERTGDWLLAAGYYLPGVRHFTALTAGVAGLPFGRFSVFAYSGAAIWVATFLTLGYLVGERWETAMVLIHRYTWWVTGGAFVLAVVVWMARGKIQQRWR